MIIKTKYLLPLILIICLAFTLSGYCRWYIPDVHYDPDNAWSDETLIYDGLDNTAGYSVVSSAKAWSSFILLDVYSQLHCEKVKFLAYYKGATGIEQIDIDLYYDSDWHDLYEGVFDNEVWTEIQLPISQFLYSARVRFYAKKADTALLYGFEFWNPDITIGNAATDRAANVLLYYTRVDNINHATGSGTLDTIEIYLLQAAANDVYVGIFYLVSPLHLSTRDYVNLGTVAIGYHEITTDTDSNPISLDVETDDMIGIFCLTGAIELDVGENVGMYSYSGKDVSCMPCTNIEFGLAANRVLSLYATGGAGGVTVGNVLFTLSDF